MVKVFFSLSIASFFFFKINLKIVIGSYFLIVVAIYIFVASFPTIYFKNEMI